MGMGSPETAAVWLMTPGNWIAENLCAPSRSFAAYDTKLRDQMCRSKLMATETPSARIIRIHKKWADGLTIIWQILVITLFGGFYLLLEYLQVDAQDRNSALILLVAVTVVSAIWQAVGLAVAIVHMAMLGSDL